MINLFFNILIFILIIITTFANKNNHRIDEESIKTLFDPKFEIVPIGITSKEEENISQKIKRESLNNNNKEGGGGVGIYWMSPEGGQDFQTWSVPTISSYGSGLQQTNIQKNVINKQLDGQGEVQQQLPSGPSISFHQQPQLQNQPQAFQGNSYSGYGQYIGQQNGGMTDAINYLNYLQKQINTYPVMIYTLSDCIPCQRAKHLLAVHYPDVHAHYLELSGNEPWQQQLQIQLQYLTGAITFPYIFVCGQYIGGGSELFELHESGQLRRLISQCLQKQTNK
ncbi:Glutaredoxin domain-containing protein [Meloidogyne graminicola]|uniref:Glutaredoxin domain-containing protein n=1 Tax=Meloidogyne graminicola TaxID=189291 RepID=A0A8S9ZV60_9BILA|nr:Glutaredoxin domain-containing protein [Meloidogyne graminicola]